MSGSRAAPPGRATGSGADSRAVPAAGKVPASVLKDMPKMMPEQRAELERLTNIHRRSVMSYGVPWKPAMVREWADLALRGKLYEPEHGDR